MERDDTGALVDMSDMVAVDIVEEVVCIVSGLDKDDDDTAEGMDP